MYTLYPTDNAKTTARPVSYYYYYYSYIIVVSWGQWKGLLHSHRRHTLYNIIYTCGNVSRIRVDIIIYLKFKYMCVCMCTMCTAITYTQYTQYSMGLYIIFRQRHNNNVVFIFLLTVTSILRRRSHKHVWARIIYAYVYVRWS
jgi:hypothetical protein